jgi:hypothetical protein
LGKFSSWESHFDQRQHVMGAQRKHLLESWGRGARVGSLKEVKSELATEE